LPKGQQQNGNCTSKSNWPIKSPKQQTQLNSANPFAKKTNPDQIAKTATQIQLELSNWIQLSSANQIAKKANSNQIAKTATQIQLESLLDTQFEYLLMVAEVLLLFDPNAEVYRNTAK
jgi:hypothetical protein